MNLQNQETKAAAGGEGREFTIEMDRVEGYAFRVRFDNAGFPPLEMDEPAPLGKESGPNASRVLAAAIGNCLSASLLFCAQKSHVELGPIQTKITVETARDDRGRWRIAQVRVEIDPRIAEGEKSKAERCRGLFEDYCVVTQSVRRGIPVEVSVKGFENPRGSGKG